MRTETEAITHFPCHNGRELYGSPGAPTGFGKAESLRGIIFNLAEEIVRTHYGDDTWDDILQAAELEGAYSSLGIYADDELTRILTAAAERLDLPTDTVTRWLGRQALPLFAARFPEYFPIQSDTRSVILSLNKIIHPEVRKLSSASDLPTFDFDFEGDTLIVKYRSPRKLCGFAMGLIEGTADHYGENLEMTEHECLRRGDSACRFFLRFDRTA